MLRLSSPFLQVGKKQVAPWIAIRSGMFFPVGLRRMDQNIDPKAAESHTELQQSGMHRSTAFLSGTMRQPVAPARSAAVRPTHFFSLRVPKSSHFMNQVSTAHADIADFHAEHFKKMIPTSKLHVTTTVATIKPEDVEQVVAIASKVVADSDISGPLKLYSRGVGQFGGGRVIFARILPERDFGKLNALVRSLRVALGDSKAISIDLKGNPNDSYVPHITLGKFRTGQTGGVGPHGNQFPREVWSAYQYEDFGEFSVPALDLCEMATDAETGYYKVVASIPLQ